MINQIKIEFDKNMTLFNFDNKIDKFVETFPKEISVLIKVKNLKNKSLAILSPNPDQNVIERKVWKII